MGRTEANTLPKYGNTACECGKRATPPPSNSALKRGSMRSVIVTRSEPDARRDGSISTKMIGVGVIESSAQRPLQSASEPSWTGTVSVAGGGVLLNCIGWSSTRSRVTTTLVEAGEPHPDLLE